MSPDGTCNELPRFLDGEMSPAEQEHFRGHLAGCEACSAELRDTLQLELLGQVTVEAGRVRPPPRARRSPGPRWRARDWRVWLSGAGALVAGVLALLLLAPGGGEEAGEVAWLAPDGGRLLEARLTYVPVDQPYRRYVPDRGEPETTPRVVALPLHALSRMEAQEDFHGIATAYLLHGAPRQALAFLERMPESVDQTCDQAVLALEQARNAQTGDMNGAVLKQTHLNGALELLDEVLRQEPGHAQALWNRALVLREMGLTLLAAESFEAVAARAEPGWSDEARSQARKLRDATLARGRQWRDAQVAALALMTNPDARLPLEEARSHQGVVRVLFYDALRAAPTPEAARRLLPLAAELDRVHGGDVHAAYVRRVAARDFSRRGPAALRFARLTRRELRATPALLEELRRLDEKDILLGALVRANAAGVAVDMEELARLATALEDPWMQLLVEGERARHEMRDGAWWKAEQRLQGALESCQGLVYRCLGLERALTDLYLHLHRPADALRYAWSGWNRAKDAREWGLEQEFLQELADVARYQHSFASARAYLEESLARMPEDCAQRTHVHVNLATVEWEDFHPDAARRALDRALACERPLGLTGAMVLSDLSRASPRPRDREDLRRALDELRRDGVPPGMEALLLFIQGQFDLSSPSTSADGHVALWNAIALTERLPEDVDARKARSYAYGALIAEEARAGRWSEALERLGRQLRLESVPRQCLLAVSVLHERTLLLAQGPTGELRGSYDASRTRPLGAMDRLVPDPLLEELRGCEHVEVLALPPVHGLPRLLPPHMAWSYRVGRGDAPLPPPAQRPASHLVVTHVATPASLKLPQLDMLEPPRMPDPLRVELRGTQATPSRVLAGMADATEVELHAHGLFSSAVSDASLLVLAPDGDGRYALTAERVREARLSRSPLVLLVACSAARTAPFRHEPFSLPVAFIQAGARVVLAATVDIPDTAGAFFEAVRGRIRDGVRPSVALRDARTQWLKQHPRDAKWLNHVLLFE